MGSFSPQELAVLHARTAALQKEYGARFGFLPNEKIKEEYMAQGTKLMKGLTSVDIIIGPIIRSNPMGLIDRLSPKTRKKLEFHDLLEHVNVCDDSGSGKTENIYIHVYSNSPYRKVLQNVLLDFRSSDLIGFDRLIRHMYRTQAYFGAIDTLNKMIHERLNFEDYLRQLGVSDEEILKKELSTDNM